MGQFVQRTDWICSGKPCFPDTWLAGCLFFIRMSSPVRHSCLIYHLFMTIISCKCRDSLQSSLSGIISHRVRTLSCVATALCVPFIIYEKHISSFSIFFSIICCWLYYSLACYYLLLGECL